MDDTNELDLHCSECGTDGADFAPGNGHLLMCPSCGHAWEWDVETNPASARGSEG